MISLDGLEPDWREEVVARAVKNYLLQFDWRQAPRAQTKADIVHVRAAALIVVEAKGDVRRDEVKNKDNQRLKTIQQSVGQVIMNAARESQARPRDRLLVGIAFPHVDRDGGAAFRDKILAYCLHSQPILPLHIFFAASSVEQVYCPQQKAFVGRAYACDCLG
jgi:hypothetical protein